MEKGVLLKHIDNIEKLKMEVIRSRGTSLAYDHLIAIYEYLKEVAPEFYKNGQMDWNYRTILHGVYAMERVYLPDDKIINFEPHHFDSDPKLRKDRKDHENILNYIVDRTRKYLIGIGANTDDLERFCNASAWFVYDLATLLNIKAEVEILIPGFQSLSLGIPGSHCYTVITLQDKTYLIDCTYSQYFLYKRCISEKIGVPLSPNCRPGKFMMMNESRRNVARKILEDGWIELTDDVLKDYLDGFALSFRNGLYYESTEDFSFVTPYTAKDYREFLEGENNQAVIEGEENVSIQFRPLKDTKIKFHF